MQQLEAVAPPPAPSAAPLTRRKSGPKRRFNAPSPELQELKDRFLEWMAATRYAQATINGEHYDLECFYKFLSRESVTRIADVTPELLNAYSLSLRERADKRHDTKAISMTHVWHRLDGLRRFFGWLGKNMIVLVNPAEDLEFPKIAQTLPRIILTQDEARRLLATPDLRSPVGYRDKAMLEVLYSTGVRSGELFKLRVDDFDAKAGTLFIHQGKGNKDRIIPLVATASAYLADYLEKIRPAFAARMKRPDDGTMFLNYTGGKVTLSDLGQSLKRAYKAAALDKHVTPMTLRHSIASHLLENGMNVRYIQEFLGHETLQTTQIYAKVTLSGLRKHYNKHHPKEKRARQNMA